jgi:hypothetical protein
MNLGHDAERDLLAVADASAYADLDTIVHRAIEDRSVLGSQLGTSSRVDVVGARAHGLALSVA